MLLKPEASLHDISGLEITGNTASVELQVETEADLVVAIYNEQQIQMLASGKTTVSSDKNKVEVNISGEIPEYFIASAYLLDIKTHEALCDAYTTELYTKEIIQRSKTLMKKKQFSWMEIMKKLILLFIIQEQLL